MNILVTGCAGFVGTNLCKTLMGKGHNVIGIDDLSYGYRRNIEDIKLSMFHECDIQQIIPFTDIDIIYHQANLRKNIAAEHPRLDTEITVNGTRTLLDYALRNKISKFIYASSSLVYGEHDEVNEESELTPICYYGVSKVAAENLVMMYRKYGLKTCIFRYFQGYGPYQDTQKGSAIIPTVIRNLLNKEPIIVYGDGLQTRSFTWIDDITNILCLPIEGKCWGETYNVTAGEEYSIIDIINLIINLFHEMGMPVESPIFYRDAKKDDAVHLRGDNLKISKMGILFNTKIKENLKKTIEFYKNWI
jgi:nucleoside-diphosphate-sugar epimerase